MSQPKILETMPKIPTIKVQVILDGSCYQMELKFEHNLRGAPQALPRMAEETEMVRR